MAMTTQGVGWIVVGGGFRGGFYGLLEPDSGTWFRTEAEAREYAVAVRGGVMSLRIASTEEDDDGEDEEQENDRVRLMRVDGVEYEPLYRAAGGIVCTHKDGGGKTNTRLIRQGDLAEEDRWIWTANDRLLADRF